MKSLNENWTPFVEYCRKNNIPLNGNHMRKLKKLADEYKEDITPTSSKKFWVVFIPEADKIFN